MTAATSRRARQHGRARVPADALVGRADAARHREFSDQRPAHAARLHSRAGADQACRGRAPMPSSAICSTARVAGAIQAAAPEVADGAHDDQFPVDVFQTGSGTSSNMNANEVIAHAGGARWHARCIRTIT